MTEKNGFAEYVEDERARIEAQALLGQQALLGSAEEARLRQEAADKAEKHAAEQTKYFTDIIQQDAAHVAEVARESLPQDAVIGRLLRKSVGWIVWIGAESFSDGEGYSFRSWHEVGATILSPDGKLLSAAKVRAYKNDYPLNNRWVLERVLRRTSGLQVVRPPHQEAFNFHRRNLANFVIENGLDVN